MGIERSLREAFGEQLREVVQVGDGAVNPNALTIADVDSHLDILRPAISGFGGRVQVQSVDPAARQCVVMYEGPPTVAMGIQAAIKDKLDRPELNCLFSSTTPAWATLVKFR